MSYDAKVFRVMIASPSDVAAERTIIREVVAEWNVVHSTMRSIVLLPVGWETHSAPEMGDRPQSIINKRILKDCDLLVGVFWTRIGTATGEYPSGTVEEIEEHIKAGKPAMIYFSMAPVVPDSIDAAQYEELKKFRDSCQPRGLYETYTSFTDFKDKFYRQLQLKLNTDTFFTSVSAPLQQPPEGTTSAVPSGPSLTREAQFLLKEVSQDSQGMITRIPHLGGLLVQTNGKELMRDNNPKTRAIWDGAIKELEEADMIEDRGFKREIFGITREGYEAAELITL